MKVKIIFPFLVVFLLTMGVTVAAQQSEAGEKAVVQQAAVSLPLDHPLISIAIEHGEELVLSDGQVQRLRSLRSQFQKDAVQRRAELRIQEIELDDLLVREPLDLAEVEAKVKRIEELRSEGHLSRIRTLGQGKALLSDQQKKKLASLLERDDKKRRHPQGWPGGCPGPGCACAGAPWRALLRPS